MNFSKPIAIAALFLPLIVWGDSWLPPRPQAFASSSAAYVVRIEPGNGKEGPDQEKCRAFIFAFNPASKDYEPVKDIDLANVVAPVEALIRGDGRYLVTFDDYFSVGWGDNIIVVYDLASGTKTALKLEDFLSSDQIANFERSTASRHWRGQVNIRHDQRYIYIGSAGSYVDKNKVYPSFILDLEKKTVEIDRREASTTSSSKSGSPKSWWQFWN